MKSETQEISEIETLTASQRVEAVKAKIKNLLGKDITESEKKLLYIYNQQQLNKSPINSCNLVNNFREKLKKIKDK